jgi:hypothetical protein
VFSEGADAYLCDRNHWAIGAMPPCNDTLNCMENLLDAFAANASVAVADVLPHCLLRQADVKFGEAHGDVRPPCACDAVGGNAATWKGSRHPLDERHGTSRRTVFDMGARVSGLDAGRHVVQSYNCPHYEGCMWMLCQLYGQRDVSMLAIRPFVASRH